MRSTATGWAGALRRVEVYKNLDVASELAARIIVTAATEALARRGHFSIALAGGETPRRLYELLARDHRDRIAWDRTDVCFGDERCVPPSDPASNYGMARSVLLARVPLPPGRAHRILGEMGPEDAAADYDVRLRRIFDGDVTGPTFDVVLLGVGADGHTASLFPGDAALEERERWAMPTLAPPEAKVRERVTVTLQVINRARTALVLCAGSEKRDVVQRILRGTAPELPASRVRGIEQTLWMLDRAAAG